ncbi:MAG TPA: protein kinase [Ktedonobacteraceae bacterium]|nr:protein kinase [Ktedonobacteraceae bacterium]
MECPYCHADNRDGVNFCGSCGRPLNPNTPAAVATSTSSTSGTGSGTGNSRTLTPGSRLQGGRYVIKRILGQGGMGAALLATDIRLDSKNVVIKELISDNTDPTKLQEDVRNFKREVATLAHIEHPLVPAVTDHFQEGTRYFMVQEYVEGENLEERIDRVNQPLKEKEALEYTTEVLDVLDYLTQQTPPIVHRDIKPANIIIGAKDKKAHLVDFGIARADAARNAKRKQTSALGTPGYAPPEQYQGNADPRSDLYALGATLHHLLTNRDPRNHPPFTYPPARTLNQALSPEVEKVISRAVNNDINQRYQSAAAMKRDIDEILFRRFGVSGSMSSYTLGTSGPMSTTSGANAPTFVSRPQQQQTPPPPPPMPAPYPSPQPQYQSAGKIQPAPRRSNHLVRNAILLLLVILLIGAALFAYIRLGPNSRTSITGTPTAGAGTPATSSNGIGVTKAPDGEMIGVSDGTFAFDTNRPSGSYMIQAAAALKSGNSSSAESLWQAALGVSNEFNNAEALIYQEDQRVLSSGSPYITIVVGTMLTGDNVGVGRDDLQGAYVAQKEYNDGAKLSGGTMVRLLVANAGNSSQYATTVARQIVQLAQRDHTFVGVMGWPFSSYTQAAINTLTQAHIMMVSQTASTDLLSGASPYFFRVAPPNTEQGQVGAKYAEQVLHARTAALFIDPSDPYSETLGNDFQKQFTADGNTVFTEQYVEGTGGHAALPQLLNAALNHQPVPDIIYFSGYAADVSVILTDLPTSGPFAKIPVLGGDALYELSGYTSSASAADRHLHFTSFAYPDEWHGFPNRPAFFGEYSSDFDPGRVQTSTPYGYTRPDSDAMLSYDAMLVFLNGSNALLSSKKTISGSALRTVFLTFTGANAIQGVSGQISFAANGDPVKKAFVILFVDANGFIQQESIQGCFLVGKC